MKACRYVQHFSDAYLSFDIFLMACQSQLISARKSNTFQVYILCFKNTTGSSVIWTLFASNKNDPTFWYM